MILPRSIQDFGGVTKTHTSTRVLSLHKTFPFIILRYKSSQLVEINSRFLRNVYAAFGMLSRNVNAVEGEKV